MEENGTKTRIAALGDLHFKISDRGNWTNTFRELSQKADVLLLAGDITDTGRVEEAEALIEELHACTIPVVGVLGNHDHDMGLQDEIKDILTTEHVHILDGTSVTIKTLGIAGIKGFGGGFGRAMLSMYGEKMMKDFVQEAVDESLKLDAALARISVESEDAKKIVVMHYAPIPETIKGEPPEIFPFLGCSRFTEPINRRQVDAVFHGHAHIGTLEGSTSAGVRVFNVAKPILIKQGFTPPIFFIEI